MTFLEVLALIGYSLGAWMHLWVSGALWQQQRTASGESVSGKDVLGTVQNLRLDVERLLCALALVIGIWHGCNLITTLYTLFGFSVGNQSLTLRLTDTLLVAVITVAYSLLLHVHLILWAQVRGRALTFFEKTRAVLSYSTLLFLPFAVQGIWRGDYAPMFEKLRVVNVFAWQIDFVQAFALWATYVLFIVAATDVLIARITKNQTERRMMNVLAATFLIVAAIVFVVHGLNITRLSALGAYLQVLANLGSLLPTALLAYYIYRYRYLELIIEKSLVTATFAVVVLVAYLYGVQVVGAWLTARYDLRPGVVVTLLTLLLAVAAAPLRHWLDRKFQQLFGRETELYREVINRLSARAWQYKQLPELLHFVEQRTVAALNLKALKFLVGGSVDFNQMGDTPFIVNTGDAEQLTINSIDEALKRLGYDIAYPLSHDDKPLGTMLVAAHPQSLDADTRCTLAVLAAQVSLAIEECRLVEENVQLERRLAHGERLAELGRMTATVAHEIKNPLSSIKIIAQVMSEDETLPVVYERDLKLIIGETNRLNRSVTQMLDWTRHVAHTEAASDLNELVSGILRLFQHEAERHTVHLTFNSDTNTKLDGRTASAVRDALSNLILNAIQASHAHGRVTVAATQNGDALHLSVTDEGEGIAAHDRERIWQPFFTTKQQGTGLGLAIVKKRIEEIGGTISVETREPPQHGARFEIRMTTNNLP
ncbi:MAG: ATP-binding protein [Pyrinomonadaceae bacterium MAG19_C2-C3]|nr:ATP-binding protein [Pyrinomonadaceae bacterium MAG19_C2-C3]